MTSRLSEQGASGGATPWSPYLGLLLAPIASRCLQGCKIVSWVGQHDLHTVLDNYMIEHSSTFVAHKDKVAKTT